MFFFHYHSFNQIFWSDLQLIFLHFNACILPSIIRHILLHHGKRVPDHLGIGPFDMEIGIGK